MTQNMQFACFSEKLQKNVQLNPLKCKGFYTKKLQSVAKLWQISNLEKEMRKKKPRQ